MNYKATLSDITINFTPDEWEQVKNMGDISVPWIQGINDAGINEDPDKLPQIKKQYKFEQFVPCICTKYFKNRLWVKPDCKAKHSESFTAAPTEHIPNNAN